MPLSSGIQHGPTSQRNPRYVLPLPRYRIVNRDLILTRLAATGRTAGRVAPSKRQSAIARLLSRCRSLNACGRALHCRQINDRGGKKKAIRRLSAADASRPFDRPSFSCCRCMELALAGSSVGRWTQFTRYRHVRRESSKDPTTWTWCFVYIQTASRSISTFHGSGEF